MTRPRLGIDEEEREDERIWLAYHPLNRDYERLKR